MRILQSYSSDSKWIHLLSN